MDTQRIKPSFSSSVKSGMGSLLNAADRKFYELEHFISTKFHRAGERQIIILDRIELGRAPECQVRFDDSCPTVSRHHAAIARDGDNWKLVQLSATNSTLLNGHPIDREWYLQSGDEIQLSVNGPKLRFKVAEGDEAAMGTIALKKRISLFGQQALRPYKWAIAGIASSLLLLLGLAGWYIHQLTVNNDTLEETLAQNTSEQKKQQEENATAMAELKEINKSLQQQAVSNQEEIDILRNRLNNLSRQASSAPRTPIATPKVSQTHTENTSLDEAINSSVYLLQPVSMTITAPDGTTSSIDASMINLPIGTAFLQDDGQIVASRHVVEPWLYIDQDTDTLLVYVNVFVAAGGKANITFNMIPSSGKTLKVKTTQFKVDRSRDIKESSDNFSIIIPPSDLSNDIATAKYGTKGKLHRGSQMQDGQEVILAGCRTEGSKTSITTKIARLTSSSPSDGLIYFDNVLDTKTLSGGPVVAVYEDGSYQVIGAVVGRNNTEKNAMIPLK
mgnify:CR=1 FL=1